jgi:cytochrome b561
LAQPLTGLGDALFHGRAFMLFGLQVPPLVPFDRGLFHLFGALHEAGAKALLLLIGLHIAAALVHGVVLKDGILSRMAPSWARRPTRTQDV